MRQTIKSKICPVQLYSKLHAPGLGSRLLLTLLTFCLSISSLMQELDCAAGVQVVRGPAVVSISVQSLLSAAAAAAVDDSSSHHSQRGHRSLSSLPPVQLRQQDLLRVLRT